jgi:inosine-uridine nucleoside N-ribohydrolase
MIDVWHDCDPGHDDAIALMYCLSEPKINLVGISTVHGNQLSYKTFKNAIRVLYITGQISKLEKIKVISGANKPIKRKSQICEEIHGDSGLGGIDWKDIDSKIEALGINLKEGEKQNIENVVDGIHNAYKNSKNEKLSNIGHGMPH